MLAHRRLKLDFESTLCLDRGVPALAQLVLQLAHMGTKLDKFLFLPFLHLAAPRFLACLGFHQSTKLIQFLLQPCLYHNVAFTIVFLRLQVRN